MYAGLPSVAVAVDEAQRILKANKVVRLPPADQDQLKSLALLLLLLDSQKE